MAFHIPGGGERQILDLCDSLPEAGVQPVLFDLWNPRFDEVDLVHFFSVVGGSWHFCKFVKDLGLPLVISPNLWITRETARDYPTDEIGALLEIADRVVVNSRTEADNYAELYGLPCDKLGVVYGGVPRSFLDPVDKSLVRDVIRVESPYILSVGNIEPRKNQMALIRAVKAFPRLKLLLIGHVRDESYAAQCFAEGSNQLIYAGAIPHSARLLRSAMAAAQAFVIPSWAEAPSVAALEAAAQGTPIIITRVGSGPEYFGEVAAYIDPDDIGTIEEAIKRVESGSYLPDRLRSLVATRYTIDRMAQALSDLYRSLLRT